MNKEIIRTELNVINNKIGIMRVGNIDYISLTDLARYKNKSNPGDVIIKWMSNKSSFDFYCLWEELNNQKFKLAESREFKNESANQSFTMSPSRWIHLTNAAGFISKRGKYDGGTYAHPDIAFEFASWLSPEFKLYLITEFERLKRNETYQEKIEWNATRLLSKVNYVIHTDAIKEYIVPKLTEKQIKFVYAEEADVLNVALFGMTAKEWRENNPELAKKGNIRDHTDLLRLVVLNNLQNTNAELIESNVSQRERLIRLNNSARRQMKLLQNNRNIVELEKLQKQVSNENHL